LSAPLRTAVIGGGLIAQVVHLPNLARLDDAFELIAIADVSPTVAGGLADRYGPARAYTDWEAMLDGERLDALVVCSPHATHAQVVLAALDRGLHVLVEKPLALVPDDAAAICRRREETGLVVEVGHMKRHDPSYQAFLDALPAGADPLRLVDVVTYDPWLAREPFVPWGSVLRGDDVPERVLDDGRAAAAEQVRRAVGADDPLAVRVYGEIFLGALIHDVNLVHGALERLGAPGGIEPVGAASWADGDAASFTARLAGGVAWHSAFLMLRGLMDFRERASLYFDDSVHELEFPSPYWPDAPRVHRVTAVRDGQHAVSVDEHAGDAYVAEVRHFHACVVDGVRCRTPPEQALRDIELLRELYRSTAPPPTRSEARAAWPSADPARSRARAPDRR
jgi:predicted dehydrogenase